jgi:tetratricopeptide (TPR) repeat protein
MKIELLVRLIELVDEENYTAMSITLKNVAICLVKNGKREKALMYLSKLDELNTNEDNGYSRFRVLLDLVEFYLFDMNIEKSKKLLENAKKIKKGGIIDAPSFQVESEYEIAEKLLIFF